MRLIDSKGDLLEMDDCINRHDVIAMIEDKQKALCPAGRFGRSYVYGTDRETYDAWQEIIDAIKAIPPVEIAPEPNPPLTLEELREMEKSPVYLVCDAFPEYTGWHIVDKLGARALEFQDGLCIRLCDYRKAGLAYRRKPEEGTV